MKLSYFAYRILPFFCVSIFFVPCTAYADQHSFSYGHNALLKSYVATTPPALITNNEWQELALDQLLKNIDTTKTVGGPWGLATVITPTTDIAVIEQRQAAVRFLVEHPNIHKRLQEILTYIAHHELHVWTYWNAHDALSISAQSLYYHVPLSSSIGWVKKFENFLNNSSSILEASILAETGSLVSSFAASICLNGLHTEFIRWLLDNNNQPLNLWQGFLNTLKQPFVQHSFALDICKEAPPAQGWSAKQYAQAFFYGTLGDRYKVLTEKHATIVDHATSTDYDTAHSSNSTSIPKPVAFGMALAPTLFFDYIQYLQAKNIFSKLQSSVMIMHLLHERLVSVALYMQKAIELNALVKDTPLAPFFSLYMQLPDHKKEIQKFLALLRSATFKNHTSYIYSRGKTLLAHKLFLQLKDLFMPLLQSVAYCDAYSAAANLMTTKPDKYCFVSFDTTTDLPYIAGEDIWSPLLQADKAVANSITLGKDTAGKMLITGPHGSGKSVILKTLGHSLILAQSLGIAPATTMTLTPFNTLATCLGAQENIEQNMSTFMAEAHAMNSLFAHISSATAENRALILIDEPYRGTLERTSGKRIYEFGKAIAELPYALVVLTTHHRQPINLEHDTGGKIHNAHVTIHEYPENRASAQFERTFKIAPGAAWWWFDDHDRQEKFADWIGSQTPLILDV